MTTNIKAQRNKANRNWLSALTMALVIGCIAGAVIGAGSEPVVIHYLSPKVLTRTAMSPDRLKNKEFLIKARAVLMPLIAKVIALAHVAGRPPKDHPWKYDFRLCLTSRSEDVCFSYDGAIGLSGGKVFSLSSEERLMVADLFGKLDEIGTTGR